MIRVCNQWLLKQRALAQHPYMDRKTTRQSLYLFIPDLLTERIQPIRKIFEKFELRWPHKGKAQGWGAQLSLTNASVTSIMKGISIHRSIDPAHKLT